MSRRERETRVPLDGFSVEQLARLREEADDYLVTKAEDLRLLHRFRDPKRGVREVAALARLCLGLRHREVFVPDRTVRELIARRSAETDLLEEAKEEYERELAGHEAWLALLAHFPEGRQERGMAR
jgi:hypothetical protein